MDALINVGLTARSGRHLEQSEVDFVLKVTGFEVVKERIQPDPVEDTLIAYVRGDGLDFHDVALLLDQDCIAVLDLDSGKGHLAGPDPDSWGPFDSSKFKDL